MGSSGLIVSFIRPIGVAAKVPAGGVSVAASLAEIGRTLHPETSAVVAVLVPDLALGRLDLRGLRLDRISLEVQSTAT